MRYPLITLIIAVVWIVMLIIIAAFPEDGSRLYYLTIASTLIIFYIGFQKK